MNKCSWTKLWCFQWLDIPGEKGGGTRSRGFRKTPKFPRFPGVKGSWGNFFPYSHKIRLWPDCQVIRLTSSSLSGRRSQVKIFWHLLRLPKDSEVNRLCFDQPVMPIKPLSTTSLGVKIIKSKEVGPVQSDYPTMTSQRRVKSQIFWHLLRDALLWLP